MESVKSVNELQLLRNRVSYLLNKVEVTKNSLYESSQQVLLSTLRTRVVSKLEMLKDRMLQEIDAAAAQVRNELWKDKSELMHYQHRLDTTLEAYQNEGIHTTEESELFLIKDSISKIREKLDIRLDIKFCEHVLQVEKCSSLGKVSFIRKPSKKGSKSLQRWCCTCKENDEEGSVKIQNIPPRTDSDKVQLTSTDAMGNGSILERGYDNQDDPEILSEASSGFIEVTGPSCNGSDEKGEDIESSKYSKRQENSAPTKGHACNNNRSTNNEQKEDQLVPKNVRNARMDRKWFQVLDTSQVEHPLIQEEESERKKLVVYNSLDCGGKDISETEVLGRSVGPNKTTSKTSHMNNLESIYSRNVNKGTSHILKVHPISKSQSVKNKKHATNTRHEESVPHEGTRNVSDLKTDGQELRLQNKVNVCNGGSTLPKRKVPLYRHNLVALRNRNAINK